MRPQAGRGENKEPPAQVIITQSGKDIHKITGDRMLFGFPRAILLQSPLVEPETTAEKAAALVGTRFKSRLLIPRYRYLKRALDVGIIVLMSPLLLPLIAVLYMVVRMSSPGPVFYSQRRPGRRGIPFSAWKFRTMVVDSEAYLEKYLNANPEMREAWEREGKLKNDPRVTKIGKFLRRSSLDELPQVWNVFIGQMSLVGPRPILMTQIPEYRVYDLYTAVPPGITGLWQTSGRSNTSFEERLAYDAHYVRNWTPWYDLYILIRTIKTVLLQEGAY